MNNILKAAVFVIFYRSYAKKRKMIIYLYNKNNNPNCVKIGKYDFLL